MAFCAFCGKKLREDADEEIDGATYAQKMMELTTNYQSENDDD